MVKISHPDTGPGWRDPAVFIEIQEAYEALADPVRRAAYDRKRRRRVRGLVIAGEPPLGPVIADLHPWADPARDAVRAASGLIHAGWDERFPSAHWLQDLGGAASASRMAADRAVGGAGGVSGAGGAGHGGGAGDAGRAGHGITRVALTLEEAFRGTDVSLSGGGRVRIPPGARHGMTLRVPAARGPAEAGGGSGVPGVIQISLLPHGRFRVVGDDLLVEVALPRAVLEQGGHVRLPTPGGLLAVAIPGRLGPGRVLRLRGQGFPATPRRRAGDLLIRLVSAG
jgi:hypothetical protein